MSSLLSNYRCTLVILAICGISLGRDLTRNCITAQDLSDPFETAILSLHNSVRSKHEDTPPLCWSETIANDAKTHADFLANPEENPEGYEIKSSYIQVCSKYLLISVPENETEKTIVSGVTQKIERYGENLYRAKILSDDLTGSEIARGAVQSWYNQEPLYNYNFEHGAYSGSNKQRASAHLYSTRKFTQVVWRSSKSIGCATSTRHSHYYFVVCFYTPEGSKGDKSTYHDNVRKKIACDPPTIYKGKHTTAGQFLLGQEVRVRCEEGYKLEGSKRGTCLKNNTFLFDEEPRCTGCEVQGIANGSASIEVGSVISDGDTVIYTCDEGFSLDSAPRVLQCSGNDFIHSLPKCRKEGYCLRPEIEDGFAYARSIDDDFRYRGEDIGWDHNIPEGENITIICSEGYELVGNYTATCQGEKFSGKVGSCKLCYIKDMKTIYNRYINVYTGMVYDRPPICFGPNTEAVTNSSTSYITFSSQLLMVTLLFSHTLNPVTRLNT